MFFSKAMQLKGGSHCTVLQVPNE